MIQKKAQEMTQMKMDDVIDLFDEKNEEKEEFLLECMEYRKRAKEIMKELEEKVTYKHFRGKLLAVTVSDDDDMRYVIGKGGRTTEFRADTGTVILAEEDMIGRTVHVIAAVRRDVMYAAAVCSDELYAMFSLCGSPEDKLRAMGTVSRLPRKKQKNLIQQNMGPRYEAEEEPETAHLSEMSELRCKYRLLKDTYSPAVQREVENLFGLLESTKNIREREKNTVKLRNILNISSVCADHREASYRDIMDALDRKLHKMDKVKRTVAEHLVSSRYTGRRGLKLLLVGRPGTGKTTIARALAEAYGIPFDVLYAGAVISTIDLKGLDSSYEGADTGWFIKTFYKHLTSEMVIVLDEIDKMGTGSKDGNPYHALLDTLSDEDLCHDAFLEVGIDTRNTIFIATANSLLDIPAYLLDRFRIIRVDDYTAEEKAEIAKGFIIPQTAKMYGLTEKQIVFEDEAVEEIVENYCSDAGARMLKENVTSIFRSVIAKWEEKGRRTRVRVTPEMVRRILEPTADTGDLSMVYTRNKEKYSEIIQEEIAVTLDRIAARGTDPADREIQIKRASYLTALIPDGRGFDSFDVRRYLEAVDGSHYGLERVKIMIAKSFNARALKKSSLASERILLVGAAGIGKTSICESMAKGLGIPYVRIPLNGIADEAALKGFPPTYRGADAGEIIKGLHRVKSTRAIVHLDEIDKLGRHEGVGVENVLMDLLDDSSAFLDLFLGVPVDLSNVLFVATANDISGLPQWVLDRFTVIRLDGYTREDKRVILTDYLIPELEKEYGAAGVRITIDRGAEELLLNSYCLSPGVRDIKDALRRMTEDALFEDPALKHIHIDARRVTGSLGPEPVQRGNLLRKRVPGAVRALAVTCEDCGMAFSVESTVIPGESITEITGLPSEVTSDSVRLAKTFIRQNYMGGKDFGVYVHFGEGAVKKDGPSAGTAVLISILSAVFNVPTAEEAAYTGEIDLFGNVFAIGGEYAKIAAAERAGCSRVFIPRENYERMKPEDIASFSIEIVPVSDVREIISAVLPQIAERPVCGIMTAAR